MAMHQLHYTSLPAGPGGRRGFQVSAASPGIPRPLEDASVQASVYRLPPGLPCETTEEIERLPVSLGYARRDGATVLYQSRYAGQDFAGRRGNYFAHAIIAEGDDSWTILPIQAWRSPQWDRSSPSPTLPPVTELVPGVATDVASVRRFLERGRLARLGGLVAAVQEALIDPRDRVAIVCPDSDDVAAWIAAVTHALPRHLALEVTFTTFSAAPDESEVLVIGTVPEVTIAMNPFRPLTVLDLSEEDASDLGTDHTSPYAAAVAAAWRAGPDRLLRLVGLAEQAAPALTAGELDSMSDVHRLLEGDVATLDGAPATLRFAAQRLGQQVFAAALRGAAEPLASVHGTLDVALWADVVSGASHARLAVPPGILEGYARGLLDAVASAGALPQIEIPPEAADDLSSVGLEWALAQARAEGLPSAAVTVLSTLDELRVRLSDGDVERLVDDVLAPALLADGSEQVAATVSRSVRRDHVAELLVDRWERALADHGSPSYRNLMVLPAPAALLVRAHVPPGSSLEEPVVLALVRAGRLGPVPALLQLVESGRDSTVRDLNRLLTMLWQQPPTPEEGLVLLDRIDGAAVAPSGLLDLLVQRLLDDAHAGRLDSGDADLADRLLKGPVGRELGGVRPTVETVRLGAYFRGRPRNVPRALEVARQALTAASHADREVSEWLLRAIVDWSLEIEHPVQHSDALYALLPEGWERLVAVYAARAEVRLAEAPPARLAVVLPGWVELAGRDRAGAGLVVDVLPSVVRRRRKRDLDEVAEELHRLGPALAELQPVLGELGYSDWTEWWRGVRRANEQRGLLGRLLKQVRGQV